MTYHNLAIYSFFGLFVITLIDTVGAVASRKLHFKYSYLSVVSFATYMGVAYYLSPEYSLATTLSANVILGIYDGTIGFWLSIVLHANTGQSPDKSREFLGTQSVTLMIVVSLIFGILGYGLSTAASTQ